MVISETLIPYMEDNLLCLLFVLFVYVLVLSISDEIQESSFIGHTTLSFLSDRTYPTNLSESFRNDSTHTSSVFFYVSC